jgi:hypothetical protein
MIRDTRYLSLLSRSNGEMTRLFKGGVRRKGPSCGPCGKSKSLGTKSRKARFISEIDCMCVLDILETIAHKFDLQEGLGTLPLAS